MIHVAIIMLKALVMNTSKQLRTSNFPFRTVYPILKVRHDYIHRSDDKVNRNSYKARGGVMTLDWVQCCIVFKWIFYHSSS